MDPTQVLNTSPPPLPLLRHKDDTTELAPSLTKVTSSPPTSPREHLTDLLLRRAGDGPGSQDAATPSASSRRPPSVFFLYPTPSGRRRRPQAKQSRQHTLGEPPNLLDIVSSSLTSWKKRRAAPPSRCPPWTSTTGARAHARTHHAGFYRITFSTQTSKGAASLRSSLVSVPPSCSSSASLTSTAELVWSLVSSHALQAE